MTDPTVFTPHEFLDDFLKEAAKAKHSIYLQSMNFESGDILQRIEKVLTEALDRKVRVNITHDWVASAFIHGTPLLPDGSDRNKAMKDNLQKESLALEERLKLLGATIIITNEPNPINRFLPMIRRNHIKLYLVDEKIVWMGGVNLLDDAFTRADLMVRFEEEKIVKALRRQFFMVDDLRSITDYKLKLTETETLFVDTGRIASSIIYKEAVDQIDAAKKSIIFMSQFVPDGSLLNHLMSAAGRGVKVEVITSVKSNILFTSYPTRLAYLYFKRVIKKQSNITLHHLKRAVHAKLLIIDGDRALFGSHNYTYSGVLFGTEEVMIETVAPPLIKQLEKVAFSG